MKIKSGIATYECFQLFEGHVSMTVNTSLNSSFLLRSWNDSEQFLLSIKAQLCTCSEC